MATIIRLLMLLVLCAPFGGASAQENQDRLWHGYDPGQATEMLPPRTARGIYQQVIQRVDVQRLRTAGSPGIRWVYASERNFLAALRQKYQSAFESNYNVAMVNFLRMIPSVDGQPGLWLPVESDITSNIIRPPLQVVRPAPAPTAPSAGVSVTQEQFQTLLQRLERQEREIERLRQNGATRDQVSALERTLGQATAALGALTRAQEEQWRTAGERVGQLSAEVAAQHRDLRTAVAQLEQQLAAEPRQVTVERFILPSWLGWVLAAIAVLALGALVVALRARRSAHDGHERISLVRKDLVAVKDDLGRQITEHQLSPRFDTTLVSPEAIARLRTGECLSVSVTLSTGETVTVTVTRCDLALAIGPLRRNPGGPAEVLTFPLNAKVASIIAKAGREGRIGSVVEPVVRQADAA